MNPYRFSLTKLAATCPSPPTERGIMESVVGQLRCPNTFCNVPLMPLAEQVKTNVWAGNNGLHVKYPLAGFTFTHNGSRLCHACSEMYKAVLGRVWWINAEAEEMVVDKCEYCTMLAKVGSKKKCYRHGEDLV